MLLGKSVKNKHNKIIIVIIDTQTTNNNLRDIILL